MRTCLLAATGLLLVASVGCNSMNFARRGESNCDSCGEVSLAQHNAESGAGAASPEIAQAGYVAGEGDYGQVVQIAHHGRMGGCNCDQCGGHGHGAFGHGGHGGRIFGHGHMGHAGNCYGGNCGGHGMMGHGGHAGAWHNGGFYGPYGGAYGTPGYPHAHHQNREYIGPQGPSTAQVGYPYYTTRGPRDFLLDNPPSIGR